MTKEEKEKKIAELREEAKEYKRQSDYYNALQLALKKVLNGTYGAFANEYFILFNNDVANAITAQGRNLTQTMYHLNDTYWYKKFHKDYKLHRAMNIEDITPISEKEPVTIYGDTDSVDGDTIIDIDGEKKPISQWYNDNICNGSGGTTIKGHESVKTNDKILNYTDGKLDYSNVKRIIRHKVSKEKWVLRTKSGKEVYCTADHSLMVYRDNNLIAVKPQDVLKTDKVLVKK